MSDKTLDYFLHENKCSPDEAKSLMFHLSTIRTRKLNEAIESCQFVCARCMIAHKRVYYGCDYHKLEQQNEIYRKALEYYSNETYMKEIPQVPYWEIGSTATKALQDAQKLAGGK